MIILNQKLVKQQNLSPKDIDLLQDLHKEMQILKDKPLSEITDIPEYIAQIENLEYAMQDAWKFTRDKTYHTHWFTDPKCLCPKLDNFDLRGVNRRIITTSCPLHGDHK